MELYSWSAYEAVLCLQKKDLFSFSPEKVLIKKNSKFIKEIKPIQHPALINYLLSRKIPLEVAQVYCKEIWHSLNNKMYFSLGLENDAGGWEMRNKYFKNSSSPKSFTYLKKNCKTLLIAEGMFDFLSLAVMDEDRVNSSDVIVLNSLSFIHKLPEQLSGYENIRLYLDNDSAGNKATGLVLEQFDTASDKRNSYRGFKDLNEKLLNKK